MADHIPTFSFQTRESVGDSADLDLPPASPSRILQNLENLMKQRHSRKLGCVGCTREKTHPMKAISTVDI